MTNVERMFSALMYGYPSHLRAEYSSEMLAVVRAMSREPRYSGLGGRLRLWSFLLRDSVTAIARERVAALPRRSAPVAAATRPPGEPLMDALIASLAVLALYVATLAPTVVFWDSGEYLTAAHVRGIPHPPGNPLFVILAHGWERLLTAIGVPVVVSLNLFSAVVSAAAHFFWFLVAYRIASVLTDDPRVRRAGAAAAVALSATAFTVWYQSNVTEKPYSLSLLSVAFVSWLILRWSETRSARLLVIASFAIALTSTNHLMGVLVAPAVGLFVLMTQWRVVQQWRVWAACAAVAIVGLTPQFFLPIRGAQLPVLNENAPKCESTLAAAASIYTLGKRDEEKRPLLGGCESLTAMLAREQYGKPSLKLDPTVYPDEEMPRPPHLFARQFGNYLQYFNWQWARSINGDEVVFGGWRLLVTLLFVWLGFLGARAHWRRDRKSALYLGVLFATLSLGLISYMNFKYGYSIAREQFPSPEMHEVRERDYFFLISFSVWALWAGIGLIVAWQQLADRIANRRKHNPRSAILDPRKARLYAAPVFAIALIPLGLNWQWATRADDYTARDWAYNVLMSVEPYGALFTNGDNDTFPLWYLQEVEGIRRDVTVMVTAYLNTDWYARQVRDITQPCTGGQAADADPTRVICQRAYRAEQVPKEIASADARKPVRSILPLTNEQIAHIIATPFVVQNAVALELGQIDTVVPAGTTMFPADTFVAAIVQASIGERPIHFTTPSPSVEKLGLINYTVRTGLTFKLNNGAVQPSAGIVALPDDLQFRDVTGAFIDLPGTEKRLNGVFQYRGRLLDADTPFVDRAVSNILLQYAWAHIAAAQGYAARADEGSFKRHAQKAEWWQSLTE